MYVLPGALRAPVTDRLKRLPRYGAEPAGRPLLRLGAVAAAYTLVQLLLVLPGTGLGWDETVYVSQVGGSAPAAFFSAPRARGISYLVAPVAAFTTSTTALRVFLALLSGAGLLGALWIWRRLLPVSVLAWAGALFGSLWISVFYGPQAMPNLWCAFGSLAAAGCFLRAVRSPDDRAALPGLGLCVAVVALMRPPDAAWLVLALAAAALLVPGWRRPAVLGMLIAGAFLGALPWIVEAYTTYGGVLARLHRASDIQGGMGWNVAIGDYVRSLQGKVLCRPCTLPWSQPHTALWWFALPLLVAGGISGAARSGRKDTAVLAAVTAAVLALPYLFLMGYAAPRFLLPSYALLALPVGERVRLAFARRRHGSRPLVLVLLPALLLGSHLLVQAQVLGTALDSNHRTTQRLTSSAGQLQRLGLRPPCTVTGPEAVTVGYYASCASRQSAGHDTSISSAGLRQLVRGPGSMAVTVPHGQVPPRWARGWPSTVLSMPGLRAYVAPRAGHR